MNVAIICNKGFGTDGISWFISNNYKKFSDSSIHYHLVFPQYIGEYESVEKVLNNFQREGTSIICIPKEKGLLRFAYQLREYLKRQNIDVVHIVNYMQRI